MLKSNAAAYLAGVNSTEGAQASAPTNLHVLSGTVGEASADGKVQIAIDGLIFGESDSQFIEVDTLGGLEEGDIATIVLSGESGHAMTPLAIGGVGGIDRITVRIAAIEADYIKVEQLDAAEARIEDLEADHVSVDDLDAATARIGTLETTRATVTELEAATARIHNLEVDHVSINEFEAEQANIDTLQANTADIATIRANAAKVANLTAAQLEADHATIGSLDTNYTKTDFSNTNVAWINNGVIANGSISSAMINDVSANKLTAGTINGSVINVTNLNADNITTGTINGQRIGTGSLSLDKLADDVYTESEINGIVDGLNDRIDGAIETFTGTVVPTLQNAPASSWTTTALKDQHVGDVYYVVNEQSQQNGYCYRFTKSGSTYSWQLIKDSDVTAALSRLQTAEGKIEGLETFETNISSWKTDTDTELTNARGSYTSLSGRLSADETAISTKVETSTFNTVSQKVDTNEANITSLSTVVSNNGLTSSTNITNTVNTVQQTASTNSSNISSLQTIATNNGLTSSTNITSKVSSVEQDLDGYKTTVSNTYATQTALATTDGNVTAAQTDATNALGRQVAYSATSSTAATTATKVASCTNFPTLAAGTTVTVRFSYANISTGAIKLNVNSTGDKTVYVNGAATSSTNQLLWAANANVTFTYDGTYWRVVSEPRTWYGTGSVAAAIAEKTATINEVVICKGTTVVLNMTYENTSTSATLNVTSTGPKNVYYGTTSTSPTTSNGFGWGAGATVPLVFDGAYWRIGDTSTSARLIAAESTVSSHTTAIQQNSTDIALRATKAEASQMAQPNLAPWFSNHPIVAGNNTASNPDYWYTSNLANADSVTYMGDGWMRIVIDNSGGTSAKRFDFMPAAAEGIECSKSYTWLMEYRNNASSGSGSQAMAQTYMVQQGTPVSVQFWGNYVDEVISGGGTNTAVYLAGTDPNFAPGTSGTYEKRFVRTSEASDSTYYDRTGFKALATITAYTKAGGKFDCEMRISVYSGRYTGPYKPYSGSQLFATQAEIKVQSDKIGMVVDDSSTSSSLVLTSNAMDYIGDHVTIKGSDGTTTVISGGKIQTGSIKAGDIAASSITIGKIDSGDSATASAILNSSLQVGGTNLLRNTGDFAGWLISGSYAGSATDGIWTFPAPSSLNWSGMSSPLPRLALSDYDGETLTLSFDYRSDDFSDTSGSHYVYTNVHGHASADTSSRTKYRQISTPTFNGVFVPTTEWQRGSITFTMSESLLTSGSGAVTHFSIMFYNYTLNSYQLRHIKLERGNVATDWSPAPEDQTSYVDESVAGIDIGGTNLLRSTANLSNTTYWYRSNVTSLTTDQTDPNGGTDAVLVTPTSSAWFLASTNSTNLSLKDVGETYTFSVWLKAASDTTCKICVRYLDSDYVDGTSTSASTRMTVSVTTSWQRFTVTGTLMQAQSDTGQNCFWVGQASDVGMYVAWPKCERGNVATDWSPAPEDMATASESIEYIEGTQTASTNAWTGMTKDAALYTGKMIAYRLPYAGTSSAATLNLTLSGGGTTGAKNVKMNINNSAQAGVNVTNHYGVGSVINMTFDGTYWRVSAGYYNEGAVNNALYRTRFANNITAATAITASRIICGTSSGYKNIAASATFDLPYPLLYAGSAIAAGETGSNNFLTYNGVNAANNGTITSPAMNSVLFLKGTVSGNTFTIAESGFLTAAVPSGEDGYCYIPLGIVYNSTGNGIYFSSSRELYAYKDGAFGPVSIREASAIQADFGELQEGIAAQLDDITGEYTSTLASVQSYLASLQDALDATNKSLSKWLDFDSQDGLVIGANGSTFKTVTTNDSMQFYGDDNLLAYTSGSEFVAPNVRADQIFIDKWMWSRRSNGNLALKWMDAPSNQ